MCDTEQAHRGDSETDTMKLSTAKWVRIITLEATYIPWRTFIPTGHSEYQWHKSFDGLSTKPTRWSQTVHRGQSPPTWLFLINQTSSASWTSSPHLSEHWSVRIKGLSHESRKRHSRSSECWSEMSSGLKRSMIMSKTFPIIVLYCAKVFMTDRWDETKIKIKSANHFGRGGTETNFWKPHRLSVLFQMSTAYCILNLKFSRFND